MTEADWLASTDPRRMLHAVTNCYPSLNCVASDRKLRLFACACCRAIWDQLTDERSRRAVIYAERVVDEGVAFTAELEQLREWARHAFEAMDEGSVQRLAAASAWATLREDTSSIIANSHDGLLPAARMAVLLRDLFGNPWRPWQRSETAAIRTRGPHTFPCLPEAWLRWQDGTVPKIAQALYDDRRFEEMPILADALEDAGCNEEDLLMHCRGRERCDNCWGPEPALDERGMCPVCLNGWRPLQGPHVRGCWCLDLLAGKE